VKQIDEIGRAIQELVHGNGTPWMTVSVHQKDAHLTEYGGVRHRLTDTLISMINGQEPVPDALRAHLDAVITACGTSSLAKVMTRRRVDLAVQDAFVTSRLRYTRLSSSTPCRYQISA